MIRKSIIISLFLAINIAFAIGYTPPPVLMPPDAAVPDAVAWGVLPISGTVPVDAAETCGSGSPVLDFWWDGSVTSMASNVCSSFNDTTFSPKVGDGEINVTSGYIELTDESSDGDDLYQITSLSADDFPLGDITIAYTLYVTNMDGIADIFSLNHTSGNYIYMRVDTGIDLQYYRRTASAEDQSGTLDLDLSQNTLYYIVLRMGDTEGVDVWVSTAGWPTVDTAGDWVLESGASTITAWGSGTPTALEVGNDATSNFEARIDDFKIYDGWKTYP